MVLHNLLARLLIYESNMRVLHWKVTGKEFDRAHSGVTDPMTAQIHSDIDVVAEKILMLGANPLDYLSTLKVVKAECQDVKFASADVSYTAQEVYQSISTICQSICSSIQECLASELIQRPENVSIKARLESMHEYYDLQLRFINKNRIHD